MDQEQQPQPQQHIVERSIDIQSWLRDHKILSKVICAIRNPG